MRARSRFLLAIVGSLALALLPTRAGALGFGRKDGHGRSRSASGSKSSGSSSGRFGRRSSSGRPVQVYTNGYRGSYYRQGYGDGSYRYQYGYGYHPYRDWDEYPYGPPVVVEPYYSVWGIYPDGYYAYGYYPYWGAPPIEAAPRAPSTTVAEIFLGGMASRELGVSQTLPAFSGTIGVDGRRWGFNIGTIVLGSVDPNDTSVVNAMPLTSLHLTYSLIADPHARVRFELGGSGIVAPAVNYIGPDAGASAQLAVLGPIALEGAAHYTPLPARILDVEADAALHFGALGLKAGWRYIRLDDTSVNSQGGVDSFNGPEVSVGLVW